MVLNDKKNCPKAEEEEQMILESERVVKALEENKEFLTNLSASVGTDMTVLKRAKTLFSDLSVEQSRGYNWSAAGVWSPDYERQVYSVVKSLAELHWDVMWDNSVIERVRAGPLIDELVAKNMASYVKGKPVANSLGEPYKLLVYSTHDTKLAALLNAFDVFNRKLIPFGAAVLLELHQQSDSDSNDFFVKVFYHNLTLTNATPYLLTLPDCDHQQNCPFNKFAEISERLIPRDWNAFCGLSASHSLSLKAMLLIISLSVKLF